MAITVLGILMAIAVPSFRTFTIESRITATSTDLYTALNLARSEALRRSGRAVVCASDDQATCTNGEDWGTGWIVFVDPDGDGEVNDPDSDLLQVWPAPGGRVTLVSNRQRVAYNQMGMSAAAATFAIASEGCAVARQVNTVVSLSGSVRSNRTTCVD